VNKFIADKNEQRNHPKQVMKEFTPSCSFCYKQDVNNLTEAYFSDVCKNNTVDNVLLVFKKSEMQG
jgi:hypothetical protein